MSRPDPILIEPHLSNRIVRSILVQLDEAHGAEAVDRALETVGMPRTWFDDPEAWVSETFHLRMLRVLYGLEPDQPGLPGRDDPFWRPYLLAGRGTLDEELVGVVWPVLRAFASPRMVYRSIAGLAGRANSRIRLEVVDHAPRRATLELHLDDYPRELGPASCWNAIGILEAMPSLWNLPRSKVVHTSCAFDPDHPAEVCRYEVMFWVRSSQAVARALAVAGICGALAAIIAAAAGWSPVVWLLLGGVFGGVLESWRGAWQMRHQHAQDATHFAGLLASADERYRELWEESAALRHAILTNAKLAPYLPEDLVRKLKREAEPPSLGGEDREVTILFSDLRGYSTLSEHLDPNQVVQLLNDYFGVMTELVERHRGTVLDYIGDGLLAVFGAPDDLPGHPVAATRCALAMQDALAGLNAGWEESGLAALWSQGPVADIACRIGLHTERVVAGNIGSAHRMKYSVVGDAVNVAARLETLNKDLGTLVLVSGDTFGRLPEELQAGVRPLGSHTLKGREQQVEVFGIAMDEPGEGEHGSG